MKFQFHRSKFTFTSLIIVILFSVLWVSCKSNSNNVNVEFEDGISLPIRDLLGENVLNALENDLGFPIYRGDDPPNVEAVLLSSDSSPSEATVILKPNILEKTTVPGDAIQPGDQFGDILIRFSNMDTKNLTVDFDRVVLGSNPFIGPNSFIIGDGKTFTVFGKQEDIVEQDTVISVNFFSGKVQDGGVAEAKGGILVIENQDIGYFIPNGTGRLFKDGDGFADLDEWPRTGQENNLNLLFEPFINLNQQFLPD